MYKKLISSILLCMQFNKSLYHRSLRAFVGRPLTSVMHDNHRAKAFAFSRLRHEDRERQVDCLL